MLKAALGLALFFGLPQLGYSGVETRTAVFLYESLAQLAFVYPARLITSRPARNSVLNWIVAVSVLIQLATVMFPGLRAVLGLETLDTQAYNYIVVALACLFSARQSPPDSRGSGSEAFG